GDLRKHDSQTAAAMPKHRVRFVKRLDSFPQMLRFHLELASQLSRFDFIVRQKLVQRRIERANRYRQAVHRLEYSFEVLALELEQFRKSALVHPHRFFEQRFEFSARSAEFLYSFSRCGVA